MVLKLSTHYIECTRREINFLPDRQLELNSFAIQTRRSIQITLYYSQVRSFYSKATPRSLLCRVYLTEIEYSSGPSGKQVSTNVHAEEIFLGSG